MIGTESTLLIPVVVFMASLFWVGRLAWHDTMNMAGFMAQAD
jgi:hypothetical protein